MTNHITTKLTYQNQDQRHKYHHLTKTLHLTLKMTTAQVVKTSVTNNSLSKDYPHPDDHAKQITDTPGFRAHCSFSLFFKAFWQGGKEWLQILSHSSQTFRSHLCLQYTFSRLTIIRIFMAPSRFLTYFWQRISCLHILLPQRRIWLLKKIILKSPNQTDSQIDASCVDLRWLWSSSNLDASF